MDDLSSDASKTSGLDTSGKNPAPSWLALGSPVVVISGHEDHLSDVLTVERVLKRDVVLSDGSRFNRTDATATTKSLYKRGDGPWPVGRTLYPDGAPEVVDARKKRAVRRRQINARNLIDSIEQAIRNTPDWDEALRLHARLGAVLAGRTAQDASRAQVQA